MITHVGQRVQLRYAPECRGTVARITPIGFTVVYDMVNRKRGQQRERYDYKSRQAENFVREGTEEVRIAEDDNSDLDLSIEIPAGLLKLCGEPLKDG